MYLRNFALSVLAVANGCRASVNYSDDSLTSQQLLATNFKPPQVFRNTDVVRTINVEKGYVKESMNLVVENIDSQPQSEYYLPFSSSVFPHVGGVEVLNKAKSQAGFKVDATDIDPYSSTQLYKITFPTPLQPSTKQTITINYHILSALSALPERIGQDDKQYIQTKFSSYAPSAYDTVQQKTKVKFPTTDVPDFTEGGQKQGSMITYGPYSDIPAGVDSPAVARYEFSKPITQASRLERDIEVSHWGGNVAFEDRYWVHNRGANLSKPFSRGQWTMSRYRNPASNAIVGFNVPLLGGSKDAYFTDDVGNISTSRFTTTTGSGLLELKLRYPVFGGWQHSFKIGYNADSKRFVRKGSGDTYALNVPMLEGPTPPEGIAYEQIQFNIILPEGAENVKFSSPIALVSKSITKHHTFMDTEGRTKLTLTAMNVIDDSRGAALIVTYEYPAFAAYRKPLAIFGFTLASFIGIWALGRIDLSIGKKLL